MRDVPQIIIIGGGGHSRVVVDSIRSCGDKRRLGVLDADPKRKGGLVLDVPVLGGDELLPELAHKGVTGFVVAIGGTRGAWDNGPRSKLFDVACSLGLRPITVIHQSATVSKWATLGAGCQVLAGAIVNAGAKLGRNVIVNSAAVVEHDCLIADHAHIATGASLASTVRVGHHAHVGVGSTVRQLISIGPNAVVAAGAVVVKDVRACVTVAGVPAKEIPR